MPGWYRINIMGHDCEIKYYRSQRLAVSVLTIEEINHFQIVNISFIILIPVIYSIDLSMQSSHPFVVGKQNILWFACIKNRIRM